MRLPALETIETLFLDAGNTLLHWDCAYVAEVLRDHGLAASAAAVERAEAAARPLLSRFLAADGGSTEGDTARLRYLGDVLRGAVEGFAERPEAERTRHVAGLVRVMRTPEGQDRLWSRVPPGVAESLAALREAGVRLVVVSNSDGTCESKLAAAGLRAHLDGVVDSHLVGIEKPDAGIFHHALRVSGSDPARTVHVGDLHHADVVGAARAGLAAVLLDPYDDWRDVDCARERDVPRLATRILAARGRAAPEVP